MHAYILNERIELLSIGHADVSCLMCCLLEYPGLKEPRLPFAEDATQLYALEDGAGGKAWTQEDMLAQTSGVLFPKYGLSPIF